MWPGFNSDTFRTFNIFIYTYVDCFICGARIRDPGWVKNQDPMRDENPGSSSESIETIFCVKKTYFGADPDPGSGIFLTLNPG